MNGSDGILSGRLASHPWTSLLASTERHKGQRHATASPRARVKCGIQSQYEVAPALSQMVGGMMERCRNVVAAPSVLPLFQGELPAGQKS